MSYVIRFYNYGSYQSFNYYHKDGKSISFINYYTGYGWRLYNEYNDIYFDVKDMSLYTEEELFQRSLIWDSKFPIELVYQIMKKVHLDDYNFEKYYHGGLINFV